MSSNSNSEFTYENEHRLAFGVDADAYAKSRPGYPDEALDYLLSKLRTNKKLEDIEAVDIGAGTGKFTELLVKKGLKVTAVEPDGRMLKELKDRYPTVTAIEGPGESTTLPDKSVDIITFATCFHWLKTDEACREIDRILRPDGVVGIMLSSSTRESPWFGKMIRLMARGNVDKFVTIAKLSRDPPLTHGLRRVELVNFTWPWKTSRAGLRLYLRSWSTYHLIKSQEEKDEYEKEYMAVVDELLPKELKSDDEEVELPYFTSVALIERDGINTEEKEKRRNVFGTNAKEYDKARSGYPKEAVDFLIGTLKETKPLNQIRIVDIGAGTGQLTRQLVATGLDVTAVEPDAKMLTVLKERLPSVATFNRPAEDSGLPDGSADLVTFATCWHWLQAEKVCEELRRILAPGGRAAIFWNFVDDTRQEWYDDMDAIFGGERDTSKRMKRLNEEPSLSHGIKKIASGRFNWQQKSTPRLLKTLLKSTSIYITKTEEERAELERKVDQLLQLRKPGIQEDDEFEIPNATSVTVIAREEDE